MTKKEMVKVIEKSGVVIDFDEKYIMRKSKAKVEDYYEAALKYMEKTNK